MSARRTFKEMVDSWKLYAQGENDIYLKNREHLEAYYKKWRKNKSRQEKIKEVSANELIKAMEYTPTSMYANSLAAPQALSGQPESQRLTRRNDEEQHGAIMPDGNESVAPNTENEGGTDQAPADHIGEAERPKRRKIRACRVGGCTAPNICPGAYNRINCHSITGGDPSQRVKQNKSRPFRRLCRCKVPQCPGHSNQNACLNKEDRNMT